MPDRKISIVIPTWERDEVLFESFKDVYSDERISEIVIVDDFSSIDLYNRIKAWSSALPKIKLFRNSKNHDCYKNKSIAVSLSSNLFCVLLDSDNKIDTGYIDKLFEIKQWDENTIYTPDFASPNFDFQAYSGLEITKGNISEWIHKPMFETMCNAANYFVNKIQYGNTWDAGVDPITSDSIYMCFKWLEAGRKINVVKGLQYFHRVWEQSHYQKNVSRTPAGFHEFILQKLKELR